MKNDRIYRMTLKNDENFSVINLKRLNALEYIDTETGVKIATPCVLHVYNALLNEGKATYIFGSQVVSVDIIDGDNVIKTGEKRETVFPYKEAYLLQLKRYGEHFSFAYYDNLYNLYSDVETILEGQEEYSACYYVYDLFDIEYRYDCKLWNEVDECQIIENGKKVTIGT